MPRASGAAPADVPLPARLRLCLRQIDQMLGPTHGQFCLDIGGEGGLISVFLRRRGGEWYSADAGGPAVESLRLLVGTNVDELTGPTLPYHDQAFDCVVLNDLLEHVPDESAFIQECHRVLKPAGRLIVNVPFLRRGSLLRPLLRLLGLGVEEDGRRRPGYTEAQLFRVLKDGFDVQDARVYSRLLTEVVDGVARHHARKSVVWGDPLGGLRRAYRRFAPLAWIAASLDALLFLCRGYRLIVRGKRRLWIPRKTPVLRDGRNLAEATLGGRIGTASALAEAQSGARQKRSVRR